MSQDDTESDALSSITRGASLYFIGKAAVDVLGFLLNLVLTRSLGVGLYGIYAYGKTVISITLVFTNLGADKSILKYLPQYEKSKRKQEFILSLSLLTSLCGGILAAATLYVFAPAISERTLDEPQFVGVLRIFGVLLVLDTIAKILHSTFRSLEQLKYEIISHKLARPTLRIGAVILALSFGFSLMGVMVALTVASLLALGITIYFLLTRFELRPSFPSEEVTKDDVFEYYNFSVPLTLKDAGNILIRRVDIFMVGLFLSSTAVGIYNISVLLAGVLAIPLAAFNQLFPPIASRLYTNGEIAQLDSLYNTVTRWIFTISFIMAIGAILFRRELLLLFGDAFTAGTAVLALFITGQLFNCIGGANGYLLMMTEHQYVLVMNQWLLGMVNILLNYHLILEYGFIGAAVATAGILALLNIVKTAELWYLEQLFPYSIDFIKPVSAGVVAAVVMYAMTFALEGIALLFVGGLVGVIVYTVSLVLFGIEDKDKEFAKQLYKNKY